MKRVTAVICAAMIALTALSGSAVTLPINFDVKKENPNLVIPIDERIVAKNGSVVIEAENTEYEKSMAITEDAEASGAEALKITAATQLQDPNGEKKASFSVKFVADKDDLYQIWIRDKSAKNYSYETVYTDLDSSGQYKNNTLHYSASNGKYEWHKLGEQRFSKGVNYIKFKYRSVDAVYDKIIITTDSNFTPEGADASPFAKDDSGEITVNPGKIPVSPEKGVHPRLYFTKEDIPDLIERLNNDIFKSTYEQIKANANKTIDCKLPEDKTDYSFYQDYYDVFVAKALLYAIGEVDQATAKQNIADMRNFAQRVTFSLNDSTYASRYMGFTMVASACVYDWSYDLLTQEDKDFFVKRLPEIATDTEVGYPPIKRQFLVSHSVESLIYQHQLAAAIALYDEYPDWYNIVTTIIFDKMNPFKTFITSSGTDFSGSTYTEARNIGALHAEKMYNVLGYEGSIFGEEYPNMFYKFVYDRLPNGIWFKDSDDYAWDRYRPDTRSALYGKLFRYIGSTYQDPVLMRHGILDLAQSGYSTDIFDILMTDTTVAQENETQLPLTRFTKFPMTTMTARTSWQNGLNAPTAMAYVNMRDVTVGDHQHRDIGAFQLYYKGMLALDSGLYKFSDHYWNYQIRSVAHNTMLVDDPNELPYMGYYVADGGQKFPREFHKADDDYDTVMEAIETGEAITAVSKAKYSGPEEYAPRFSYISSEISSAYSDKVEAYERSAVFVNLKNEDYPAAFIVYDNIKSKDSSFKKRWLLHSEAEPEVNIDTNTTVITRTDNGQNGKLVNKTLIPAVGKAEIVKIGGPGKEFWVNDKNYEISAPTGVQADMGAWRIEVSPKSDSEEDKFLNAMYVTDADRNLPELPIYREFGTCYTGATILNTMVTFSNSRENITEGFNLNIRNNGYESVSCLLTDIKAGVWKISGNGKEIFAESKEGENCLSFEAAPGRYVLSETSSNNAPEENIFFEDYEDFGDFSIRKGNNLMYLPKPTKLIDGMPYVPIAAIFTQLGATVTEKGADRIVLSNGEGQITLSANAEEYVYKGETVKLKSKISLAGGELYANLEDFTKFLGIRSISYDSFAKLLTITLLTKTPIKGVDMSAIVEPVAVTGSEPDRTNTIDLISDHNLSTYFCSVGEAWVLYDLGDVYDISDCMMAFYNGHTRKSIIDILVSEDGVNFKTAFSGMTNGKTQGLQKFKINEKARYVKVLGHGNDNGSTYNSIFELIVLKKQ